MRFNLTLANDKPYIELPVSYNHLVQSCIYSNLSESYSTFLHESGYRLENSNRKFSLFVFSRIFGRSEYIAATKKLRFQNPIQLYISSPVHQFAEQLMQLFMRDGIRIGVEHLRVEQVETIISQAGGTSLTVRTLSPVVAYSTMLRSDGRKFTVYFHPGHADFQRIAVNNLVHKARLIYGAEAEFAATRLRPVGESRRHVVTYKNTIIEAYGGTFRLEGDSRLLQTALDAGISGKNAMGFGMVEPL